MINNIKKSLLLCLIMFLLASCSTTKEKYHIKNTDHVYPPTDKTKITLVYNNDPTKDYCKNYKVISEIEINPIDKHGKYKAKQIINNDFKEAASSVGANAVINIINPHDIDTNIMGTAIKCLT